jgi:stearoyl-CoA desaturase (delta-9 desaturase)
VKGLRRARKEDIQNAKAWMRSKHHHHESSSDEDDLQDWQGPIWKYPDVVEYLEKRPNRCLLLVNGAVIDCTGYLAEHVRVS